MFQGQICCEDKQIIPGGMGLVHGAERFTHPVSLVTMAILVPTATLWTTE